MGAHCGIARPVLEHPSRRSQVRKRMQVGGVPVGGLGSACRKQQHQDRQGPPQGQLVFHDHFANLPLDISATLDGPAFSACRQDRWQRRPRLCVDTHSAFLVKTKGARPAFRGRLHAAAERWVLYQPLLSYLNDTLIRDRYASTLPFFNCTSSFTTSATLRSRKVLLARDRAAAVAFSQDSVLVPMSSITLYTFSAMTSSPLLMEFNHLPAKSY